ncbi:MAG: DinB family protein [Gemmatimonadales bacterium]
MGTPIAVTHVRELYAYNRWANDQVLRAVERLTPEQLLRDTGSSFSSIRDTLAHILGAEWIWLERWLGRSPRALLAAADFPTAAALRDRWAMVEAGQQAFLAGLQDDRLPQRVAYINTKGQRWEYALWQMLVHVVNHSTYHRGQVTTMLRQLGAAPAATDLLNFYDVST